MKTSFFSLILRRFITLVTLSLGSGISGLCFVSSAHLTWDMTRWGQALSKKNEVNFDKILLTWHKEKWLPDIVVRNARGYKEAFKADTIIISPSWDDLSHYRFAALCIDVAGMTIDITRFNLRPTAHQGTADEGKGYRGLGGRQDISYILGALGSLRSVELSQGIKVICDSGHTVISPPLSIKTIDCETMMQGIDVRDPKEKNSPPLCTMRVTQNKKNVNFAFKGLTFKSGQNFFVLKGLGEVSELEKSPKVAFDVKINILNSLKDSCWGGVAIKGWGSESQGLIIHECHFDGGWKVCGALAPSGAWKMTVLENTSRNLWPLIMGLDMLGLDYDNRFDQGVGSGISGQVQVRRPLHVESYDDGALKIWGKVILKDLRLDDNEFSGDIDALGSCVKVNLRHTDGLLKNGHSVSQFTLPSAKDRWVCRGVYKEAQLSHALSHMITSTFPNIKLRYGVTGSKISYTLEAPTKASKNMPMGDVHVHIPALYITHNDVQIFLTNVSCHLKSHDHGIDWKAHSLWRGRPINMQGLWHEGCGHLKCQLDGAMLNDLGIKVGKIDIEGSFGEGSKLATLTINLGKTGINWPVVEWVNSPGKLAVGLYGDVESYEKGFRINLLGLGPLPCRQATILLDEAGYPYWAEIKIAKEESLKTSRVIFSQKSSTDAILELFGPDINVAHLVKSLDFNKPLKILKPLNRLQLCFHDTACGFAKVLGWKSCVNGTIDLLQELDDIKVTEASLRQTLHHHKLALPQGGLILNYGYSKQEACDELKLEAQNVGVLLKFWDISEAFKEGQLKITLTKKFNENAFKGSGILTHFVSYPPLGPEKYILFMIPPFAQLVDFLATQGGVIFDIIDFDLVLTKKKLFLLKCHGGVGHGLGVGISLRGQLDFTDKNMFFLGMVSTSLLLSNLIGKIPFLGPVFSGTDGSYFLATRFSIQGPWEKPNVTINPFSIFWPLGLVNEGLDNLTLKKYGLGS